MAWMFGLLDVPAGSYIRLARDGRQLSLTEACDHAWSDAGENGLTLVTERATVMFTESLVTGTGALGGVHLNITAASSQARLEQPASVAWHTARITWNTCVNLSCPLHFDPNHPFLEKFPARSIEIPVIYFLFFCSAMKNISFHLI